MGKFDDIINMQYPNLEIEKDFPDKILRAAQFEPYAALTGHDEAVKETARLTDTKLVLDENVKEELDRKLNYLIDYCDFFPEVTITYFVPDEKKNGGKYINKTGIIKKIVEYDEAIVLDDNSEIKINDILMIESDVFNNVDY